MTQTPSFFDGPQGRRLAYHHHPGQGPGLVFLGGFMSDMSGTKAVYLDEWARAQGRSFLRFDYSGHGQSSGAFTDGTIGAWAADAEAAILTLTEGPQILIGSSMGGWISLLLTKRLPADRIAGLVTIAAAPDFTEDSMWPSLSPIEQEQLQTEGLVHIPSDYGDPYPITKGLIEDGRNHLVLRSPLPLPCPTRFLQGTDDADVPQARATTLLDHVTGPDIQLRLVKNSDHRFSGPAELTLITDAIAEVLASR